MCDLYDIIHYTGSSKEQDVQENIYVSQKEEPKCGNVLMKCF